ncbi:MAG: N-acetylmuramoyl-L-alanine amidase [Spirulinaceae cyanobacterium]
MRTPLIAKFQVLKIYWFLLTLGSILFLSSPAEAGRLVRWKFDRTQNRLEFKTDDRVQPQAQLIFNPTRLVIDLPGTTLGQQTVNQSVGGAIRQIRVGQFNDSTTRMVVELAPGYTIDPQKVEFRGADPTQWFVTLPTPQRISQQPSPSPSPSPTPSPSPSPSPVQNLPNSAFQVTRNGLVVSLAGQKLAEDDIRIKPNRRRGLVEIDLRGITLPSSLVDKATAVTSDVVNQIQFSQESENLARITLQVPKDSPEWNAFFSNRLDSLLIIPRGGGNFEPTTLVIPPQNESTDPVVTNPTNPDRDISVPPPDSNQLPTPPPTTPVPPIRKDGRVLVTIDPGHGGKDPGAIGIGGLREVDVVLPISLEMTEMLNQNGVQVQLTRDADYFVTLAGRTQLANRVGSDLFVSIHANAAPGARPGANGVETFYHTSGRSLAAAIQNSIMERFDMNNRGVKKARFYVLRTSRMPSALVEVGFVTGNEDSRVLANSACRTEMAKAITVGILRYSRIQEPYTGVEADDSSCPAIK